MMLGINPSTNKNRMNPTPNWIHALALLVLVACQRAPQPTTADAQAQAQAAPESSRALTFITITGHAQLKGAAPAPRTVRPSPELQRTCGERIADQTLRVERDGAIADVVVYLEDGRMLSKEGGSTDLRQPIIDQRKCVFKPPVVVALAGESLEMVNSDPLLHNVRADRDSQAVFNFAMPVEGMRSRRQLPTEPGILRLHCDVHPWMWALIRTFDHPYFAITDETGAYRLGKVPSGRHKLIFWHSRLPQRTAEVELSDRPAVEDVLWLANEVSAQ
jgi:plastocyanin